MAYILNDKVLTTNFEGDLSGIDDKTFIDIRVIDKDTLIKDFKIADKTYGIIIKTTVKKTDKTEK